MPIGLQGYFLPRLLPRIRSHRRWSLPWLVWKMQLQQPRRPVWCRVRILFGASDTLREVEVCWSFRTIGVLQDCKDNTEGDRCERCADGYEGDATRGTPYDCRRSEPTPVRNCAVQCHRHSDQCDESRCYVSVAELNNFPFAFTFLSLLLWFWHFWLPQSLMNQSMILPFLRLPLSLSLSVFQVIFHLLFSTLNLSSLFCALITVNEFRRQKFGSLQNGFSSQQNCQDNTEGDRCERCTYGYEGDARRGSPYDCQPIEEQPDCYSLCHGHSDECDSSGRCYVWHKLTICFFVPPMCTHHRWRYHDVYERFRTAETTQWETIANFAPRASMEMLELVEETIANVAPARKWLSFRKA